MKIFSVMLIFMSLSLQAEMTRMFRVTNIEYDQDKKNYKIIFKNQAGVYRVRDDAILDCLKKSLTENKKVKVAFSPMGLLINSCSEK